MRNQHLVSITIALALIFPSIAALAEEEVDSLIPKLGTRDQVKADAAIEKIMAIGDPAVPALIKAMNESSSSWVRSRSAKILGNMGSKKAVQPLTEILADQKTDKYVRSAAAYALGQIGDKEAAPALMEAAKEKEARVRRSAVAALGELGDARALPVLKEALLGPTDIKTKNAAIFALGKIDGSTKILAEALKERDEYLRKDAAAVILSQDGGVAVLKGTLKSDDPKVRKNICLVLGHLRVSEATPELVSALSDKDAKVRMAAAMALLSLDEKKQAKAVAALLKDEVPNVRVCASSVLIHLGGAEEVPALVKALQDENGQVRANACKALGCIGGEAAEKPLAEVIKDPDRWVSLAAVQALGKMKAGEPALIAALGSDKKWTRGVAAIALGNMGAKTAAPKLRAVLADDKNAVVRAAAAVALGDIGGEDNRRSLETALEDQSPQVREDAINALSKIGLGSSAPKVLALLDKDKKFGPRYAALRALGRAKDEKAIPSIEKLTTDKYLGSEAQRVLSELKPEKKTQ